MQYQQEKAPGVGIWLLLLTWVAVMIGNSVEGPIQMVCGGFIICAGGYAAWTALSWAWNRYGSRLNIGSDRH